MKRTLNSLLLVMLLAGPAALMAAGGSSVPSTSPEDEAAAAYERGLGHRDKAWKLEAEVAASSDEKERAKLESKIQKEYAKAIRSFRSAVDSNPQMHQAHSSLGYALRKTGQFEESLAAYNRALELQPDYSEAIEYRAEAYLGLNRLDEVKAAYMQLFRDDRERADELMEAMVSWVDQRRGDSGEVEQSAVEAFSAWVEERQKIAGNTASLAPSAERDW